ncbi:hypothetical protein HHK36_021438 [Tetracentron sinense]|uniref:Phytocyanin domain-containing protein n=1 Tax=Tetracentron sinense TaxID=13715 RepID=A0A835D9X4_TETSI|nr:hypothetical protein HHK36_021438 [Tetracentron sinense]
MGLRMGMAGYVLALVVGAALLHCTVAQTTHVVGDSLGWVIPPGGAAAYTTWASTKKFMVGDTLVFNFTTGEHDVAQVSKTAFDACTSTTTIGSVITTGPANLTLDSEGDHYYICTVGRHCNIGQKLSIAVQASSSASPTPSKEGPSPSSTPPSSPAPTSELDSETQLYTNRERERAMALRMGMAGCVLLLAVGAALLHCTVAQTTHVVGDSTGWVIPPGGAAAYTTWASTKKFMVGDTLVFNFTTGEHDVAQVSKTAFDACTSTTTIGSVITTGPANLTLDSEGDHYYICTLGRHCNIGQKLSITVEASPSASPTPSKEGPSPSTPPSSPAPTSGTPADCAPTPVSAPTAGGPVVGPTPPSSSSTVAIASFSLTVLSIFMAFLL